MKFTALALLLILPFAIQAQNTSGKIVYKQTIQVEIPDRVPKEFRDRFPTERTVNKELYFNQTTSTYKNGENLRQGEGEVGGRDRGWRMRMRGGNANAMTYKNISEKMITDNRDIMGKAFIIEEPMTKMVWKMTGQKKTILDYMVMEATSTINDTIPVTAYFSPQIPVPNGPALYHGLPGMILEVNVNDGQNIITATAVELMEIDAANLEKPNEGKKVTKEEFNKIRREKMQEMREQRGGGRTRFRSGG